MKPKSIIHISAIALALSAAHAAPLLTDNFDDTNTDASTFNNNLATTQGGSLPPMTYSVAASGGGYTVQHGNGGDMLVVGNTGTIGGSASPNHDFAIEANLANKPFTVSFNVNDVSDQWGQFGIGNVQGDGVLSNDFGILFQADGGWQAYANGAGLGSGGAGTWTDGALMTFVFSDTAGTGSAFNGNGSKVSVTLGGTNVGTFTLGQLGTGYGYLTWRGFEYYSWSVMRVDNLSIEMDATFPANETLTWTGATDANWDESTANWTNVNSFTKWFNNSGSRNNAVFDATGAAQPNVSLALTRSLQASTITFDTAGYTLGGTVTLGNSPNIVANADATLSATLQGAANITKSGLSTLSLTGTSPYSGVTILEDGVLNAASFSNYGVDSSLGNRAADSAEVGFLFQGGTLQYTGATAQSTNRTIRLGLEGGTIDASGSSPAATLSFTAASSTNFFFDPGSRTLTLTGTNTGDNTFAMAIGEAGGLTSVVKDGVGKWILSGANTYTGSTTVNGGTLSLTSAYLDNASAVTLASGAQLNLNYVGNDVIGSLEINSSGPLPGGIYNSSHPTYGSYFTGSGSLLVLNGANGVWTSLVDGVWDDPANWSGNTIASGFDQTATFNASTGVTVTLSGTQTIGSLFFDTSDYTLAGPSTLTLDSSSTPAIDVNTGRTATITTNLAGIYGLEKTGAGTLVLTAANNYSGATLVTGGLLQLGASSASNPQFGALENSSQLTIESGAAVRAMGANAFKGWSGGNMDITLNGGTLTINDGITASGNHNLGFVTLNGGTISGVGNSTFGGFSLNDSVDVTENSTISATQTHTNGGTRTVTVSAGKTLNWTGTITNGYLNVASTLIFEGTGTTVLSGANTYTGNTSINDGTLNVTSAGSLRFSPTTNGTTNSVSGSSTATLSFLGTVDLDLGTADAGIGNLWNLFNLGSFTGPTPTLTPIAVTSTLGNFTEGSAGTWELPVTGAKWVFTEADGNLAYVSATTDYDTWKTANGVTGGENDDDDADGLTNHEEYAFGLDPTGGSSVNPITVQLNKAAGTFTYTRRDTNKTDLTYTVWISTNLVNWSPATVSETVTGPVADVETVQVTLSTIPTEPKLFVQVRAN